MRTNVRAARIGGAVAASALLLAGGAALANAASGQQTSALSSALNAAPVAANTTVPTVKPSITLTSAGALALEVSWTTYSQTEDRFRIGWTDLDSGAAWKSAAPDYPAYPGPVILTGLTAGHRYRVTVQPYNSAGFGPTASAVKRTQSSQGQQGGRPGDLPSLSTSYGGNGTSLKLEWSPAPGADRYRIGWRDTLTGDRWESSGDNYSAQDSPVTLTGLRPAHTIDVWVTPYNSEGDGPTAHTTGAPAVRTMWSTSTLKDLSVSSAGPNALKVSWTPGEISDHYEIAWKDTTSGKTWNSRGDNYSASDSPVTLTGLTAGHHYIVTVIPYNLSSGDGPSSSREADVVG